MTFDTSIAYWITNTTCYWWMNLLHRDLRWTNEIYPFKKALQICFRSLKKFNSTLNALFFGIPSLMIIITFYNIFMILFWCVNNTKNVLEEFLPFAAYAS